MRGLWLDRGELDNIIERFSSEMPSRSYPERQDDCNNQRYGKHRDHHKKKRSFLNDLFD
jgi:Zn-finger nucleic acid-binding protein